MPDLVRDPIAARARIDQAAEGHQVPAEALDAAAALLADLWLAAAAHGVSADALAAVTSLPTAALDAVLALRR